MQRCPVAQVLDKLLHQMPAGQLVAFALQATDSAMAAVRKNFGRE